MITALCWLWGGRFEPVYVHRLQDMLAKHLHLEHELVCVTDDATGLDGIRTVPMPETFAATPRCRRRMQQFSREFDEQLCATRILGIDLDVVILRDITRLVDRPEPIVGWKVGHAGVYSGSFLLFDAGALDGAWQLFAADPVGHPKRVQPRGIASDQAMVNAWLQTQPPIAEWTERDGFVTYYGEGYEHLEHLGIGPRRPTLPAHARIVVLGSADKVVMDEGRYPWVRKHWGDPIATKVPA